MSDKFFQDWSGVIKEMKIKKDKKTFTQYLHDIAAGILFPMNKWDDDNYEGLISYRTTSMKGRIVCRLVLDIKVIEKSFELTEEERKIWSLYKNEVELRLSTDEDNGTYESFWYKHYE